jgi:tripartite-type tricarboxylate transporter receptor subunit TctC
MPNPIVRSTLACMASLALSGAALAQGYPNRPVTLIVPFAAGGPTDTLGRIMAERMRRALGQTVVVENVSGAGGSIGVGRVARATPDGYTVGLGHWSTNVLNGAIYKLPYDLLKDFEPVALVATNPQLVVAKPGVPAKDLAELTSWIRAQGGRTSAGTSGVGTPSHVAGVYYEKMTGTQLTYIPYRGTGPAVQDLMGGQIDVMFDQASNSLPHVRGGKLRAYAVTAKTRLPSAPDIPTVDEAGLAGLHVAIWHALWVPRGTPKDVVGRLNAAVVESLADPAVRQRLGDLGQEIPPRDQQTPEALAAFQRAEAEKWWPLVREAGIKAE